ncbi:hypothetical protein NDU88_003201 [Pleurodeles waltl]|uniref:Uncharacterized protein n=1 Tax=Pleurodeles waltl TaxID=8319 RepID=A0AAV7RHU8_PLEWA|nr:hypothetical protein NDU88_003201 [Pleurodeles waltl]
MKKYTASPSRSAVCAGPARCGPYTNPTGAGAATSAPDPHAEEANQEFHPATKAGPRGAKRRAVVKSAVRNGGAGRRGVGGSNGVTPRKQEGAEEATDQPRFMRSVAVSGAFREPGKGRKGETGVEANQEFHPVTKARPQGAERRAVVKSALRNGGAGRRGIGGRNGVTPRKQEGAEEATAGTDISASQEA